MMYQPYVKNILTILALLVLSQGSSSAQYVLSPRIGEVIDKFEREYFGLFPEIQEFVSAKAILLADHGVEFIITQSEMGTTMDTTVFADSLLVRNLVKFIEDFESVRQSDKVVNWKRLKGIATNSPVIESEMGEGTQTTVVLHSGEQIQGKLLYAGDSSIVLRQELGKGSKFWNAILHPLKAVQYYDVSTITFTRKGSFAGGAAYGMLIGAAASIYLLYATQSGFYPITLITIPVGAIVSGALIGGLIGSNQVSETYLQVDKNLDEYNAVLPSLRENAVFHAFPPPELNLLINP